RGGLRGSAGGRGVTLHFTVGRNRHRHLLLVGAEIAEDVGAAEFVVEGGAAEGALDHDLERRHDAIGPPGIVLLPRLNGTGQAQVRNRESGESRLRLGAATGGALVADFAARASGGARKRR